MTDEAEIVPKAEDEVDLSVVDRFTHVRKSVGRQSVWPEKYRNQTNKIDQYLPTGHTGSRSPTISRAESE